MSNYPSTTVKCCILCCCRTDLQLSQNGFLTQQNSQQKEISPETLFYCYIKHVPPEIVASLNLKDTLSQDFCDDCQRNNKKLVQLNVDLEIILKEITEVVRQITEKISERKRNYYEASNYNLVTSSQPIPSTSLGPKITIIGNDINPPQSLDESNCSENNNLLIWDHADAGVSEDLNDDDDVNQYENIREPAPAPSKAPSKKKPQRKKNVSRLPSENNAQQETGTDDRSNTNTVRSSDLLPHLDNPAGFECSSCHKTFSRLAILQRHDCDKPTHDCSTCGKSFSTAFVLKLHRRCHSGEQPYKCETCGKSFSIKYNLIRHIRIHTGDKPFTCEICSKSFADETGFVRHRKTHKGEDAIDKVTYKCDICSKELSEYGALKEHLFFIHKHNKKCEVCGRSFRSTKTLEKHKLTHQEKVHQCDICGRNLSTAQSLYNHILVHRGEKPIQCPKCDKSFRGNHQLKLHTQAIHPSPTTDDTFVCDKCGKVLNNKVTYKRHMKHHKSVVSTCQICEKQFTTKQNLEIHIQRVHNSKRGFECDICLKSYKTERDCIRHKEYNHPSSQESFSCEKCCKTDFKSKQAFHAHKRTCGEKPHTSKNSPRSKRASPKSKKQGTLSKSRPATTTRKVILRNNKKKRVNYHEEDDHSSSSSDITESDDDKKQHDEIKIEDVEDVLIKNEIHDSSFIY